MDEKEEIEILLNQRSKEDRNTDNRKDYDKTRRKKRRKAYEKTKF